MYQFSRQALAFRSLSERRNRIRIHEVALSPDQPPVGLTSPAARTVAELVAAVRAARAEERPVIMAFGAHTIKNGAGPLIAELVRDGWITHLATNGAGVIHDWEFAFQGASSEDVRENVSSGSFGIWEETGLYINLAIALGAYQGLGYGESVGSFIAEDGADLPSAEQLEHVARTGSSPGRRAAALDLLETLSPERLGYARFAMLRERTTGSRLRVPHSYKTYSLQAAAFRFGVPFTAHPMFGHDIIYTHPANSGAAIGRAAERDFLAFAHAVSRLDGGVYLSIGSAVMSPMIFEKSLSMGRNVARQSGLGIRRHTIGVVDLATSAWDWRSQGEPPPDHPDYYLRFMKSFHRMGGTLHYLRLDNREFLRQLLDGLA